MADTANGSPADGQISSKQWEQIKEKLKTSWHRNDPSPFDKAAFITAATGAGISDASKLADMILYAGHASQIPVKRSGQSAFSWVPLLAVAVTAQSKASPDSRSDALSLTIQGLVSAGKEAETEGVLDTASVPADLTAGAAYIDDVMLSMRKASRLGIAGGSFGRPKSLQQSTLAMCSAVTASAQDKNAITATVQAYKRLVIEVEAAKQLRDRAIDSLSSIEPKQALSPALRAVSQAIFAHQGSSIEKEVADLKSSIEQADAAVEVAKKALQQAGLDPDQIAEQASGERRERLASRPERPKNKERRRRTGRRRRGKGPAADGSSAEDETGEDFDQDWEDGDGAAADGAGHAAENGRSGGGAQQRRGGRARGGERHRTRGGSGGRDFTAPRDAATDDEEVEADGVPAKTASPFGRNGGGVAPPGFSPRHGLQGGEGADHANGEERRKSERRRRRGAQSARSGREGPGEDHAQVQAVATADGTEQCDSAEDGGKKGSRRRRGGRSRRARGDNSRANGRAADSGDAGGGGASGTTSINPVFAAEDGAQVGVAAAQNEEVQKAPGPRERRRRPSLKNVARFLEAAKADLCDPITKEPLKDPVTAADGMTYERASIEQHLKSHHTSPVTQETLSSPTLYPNELVKSLLSRLAAINAAT